jgi:peroxiredoxin
MKKTFVFVILAVAATACFAEELAVGAKAPQFALTNAVDGKTVAFKPGDGKLSVVVFTCNQCPYE